MSSSKIMTACGELFDPLQPVFADIKITDIAHALANQCRFAGHTRVHYSVAEHSVRVSELLEAGGHAERVQLWGLLHDASEAYLVDVPTPLKANAVFAGYRAAEAHLMTTICKRFSLAPAEPRSVLIADEVLLATEARDLMPEHEVWKKLTQPPLPERIRPWGVGVAEYEFLRRYRMLTGDAR